MPMRDPGVIMLMRQSVSMHFHYSAWHDFTGIIVFSRQFYGRFSRDGENLLFFGDFVKVFFEKPRYITQKTADLYFDRAAPPDRRNPMKELRSKPVFALFVSNRTTFPQEIVNAAVKEVSAAMKRNGSIVASD